jgi:hypothetical protein
MRDYEISSMVVLLSAAKKAKRRKGGKEEIKKVAQLNVSVFPVNNFQMLGLRSVHCRMPHLQNVISACNQ